MEESGSWQTRITPALSVLSRRKPVFFLAPANALDQPYIQHRRGPSGFLRVLNAEDDWL
jgi:hypothetical protein